MKKILGADEHYNFAPIFLSVFTKSFENVVSMTGDNCSTNSTFAKKFGCEYVTCAIYRFNLAAKDYIIPFEVLAGKVLALMQKLRKPIMAERLRRVTDLKAKVSN